MRIGKKIARKMIEMTLAVAMVWTLVLGNIAVTANASVTTGIIKSVSNLTDLMDALADDTVAEVVVTEAIELSDGTVLDGKGKTVRIENPNITEMGTLASGGSDYRVFNIVRSANVKISNMTIIGGSSSNMGAVYVDSSATLTMEHVTVTRSYRGVWIKNNATVIMKDCNIVRNIAEYGGGILCAGGTLIMDACSLSENRSLNKGGGAMEINGQGKLYANNVIIANNCSSEIGGAINNYGSSIYLMNSTVTGNVTTMHSYGARAGAGIGVNSYNGFYAVNCYLADNYYININNSTLTSSDIGLWQPSNPATLINCVYNAVAAEGTASKLTTTGCNTETENSATGYRNDGILSGASGTTASFSHPILLAKEPNALYVPVSTTGSAATGGVDTYFDYSDPTDVKMSYGANNTALASGMSAADTTYKVTKFYEGGERQTGVIGASIPSDAIFYTVKLGKVTNGSVDGATRYGDSYRQGSLVTLQANADSGYAFKCWKEKDENGEEMSTDNPYTFTVDSDVTLVPEFVSHTHQWSYVKSGEHVIEAYCTSDSPKCSYYGTEAVHEKTLKLELSAGDATYSGNSYQGATVSTDAGFPGTVSTNDIKYYQITTDNSGTVTENLLGGAPKDVGSYKAKITVGSAENSQTLEAAFQITPKTLTAEMVSLDHDEFVISESAQGPVVTVTDGTALTPDRDYTVIGNEPHTARGTYTVIVEGKGNYTGRVTKTWKICYQSIPDANVNKHNFSGSYDGAPHSATVSVSGLAGAVITYCKSENGNYQAAAPSYTNAGTYTVYYKIAVDGHEPKTGTLTVTIMPGATHTITVATSENGTAGAQVNGAFVTFAGYGTEITLVATPNSGYRLKKWTVISGGAIEITVSNNRFTMPDANVTVKAEFELIPSGSSGSSGSPGGSDTPTKPAAPTENYTIPVKNENTVQVEAKITDSKANVSEITTDTIDKVVKNTGTESKVDTITIDLSGAKQEVTGVILSKTTVETLAQTTAEAGNGIETATVELSNATVVLDNKTLETLADQAKGSQIELVVADTEHKNLNTAQQTTLSNYQMATTFEAYFTSDGQRISDFKGGTAIVSIKFTPEAGKDVSFYHIVYVAENGQVERYKTKYESGRLLFTTTHFSDYAVVYDANEKNETEEQPKEEESDAEANVTLDTTFRKLQLAEAKATKNAVKISWKKVTGADGYVLYGAPCNTKGKINKMKKLAVLQNGSKITYTDKKLKSGIYYKYCVKAYKLVNGKKVWLAKSKTIHVTTVGGKYGNAKAVKVSNTRVTLKKGKSLVIKAQQIAENKPIKQHVNIKFESTNTKIATVTKNGRIKAKKKGTCYIYVYAQNGVYKKIKVVVS